mgnify:FL=1
MKKVVFLGLGYIGLPTAAVAAGHGYEVVGVDVNPSVVETINQGKIHIVEPELDQIVKEVVRTGNLRAVSKPEQADAFFVEYLPLSNKTTVQISPMWNRLPAP